MTPDKVGTTKGNAGAKAPQAPIKKRGRPRKVETANEIKNKGIVKVPNSEQSIIELEYGNPSLFRKCIALLKGYSSSDLIWHFKPDRLEIRAKDHHGNVTIFFLINCKNVQRYYCKYEHIITFKLENVEDLFKSIKKEKAIEFIVEEDTKDSQFTIIIPSIPDGITSNTTINLINNPLHHNFNQYDDSNYSIKMKLTIDYIKKLFTKTGTKTNKIYIIKYPKCPLKLMYKTNTIISSNIVVDPKKIDLKCNLEEDDILHLPLLISNIKPLTTASKDCHLKIAVDKKQMASFSIILDQIEVSRSNGENSEKSFDIVCLLKIYTIITSEGDEK